MLTDQQLDKDKFKEFVISEKISLNPGIGLTGKFFDKVTMKLIAFAIHHITICCK